MKNFQRFMMASALAVCGVVSAQAQQVDGDFNQPWVQNNPWDSKNGYFQWTGNNGADYIQPAGWMVSNVSGLNGLGATCIASQEVVAAEPADYAVLLKNTPNPYMETQLIPAYMSLGTTWATAVSNIISVSNADGGCFGGKEFAYRPDALRLDYKRSHGTANATERASVIAYLWKGTYTQAAVPGNTALGTATTVDMVDRDRNILGKATAMGGAVTSTDGAGLVASIEYYIEGDAAEWTPLEVPFTYASDEMPEKLNIILAANDYFADRSTIGKDNKLTVDNVELVYWHALSALAYEGSTIEFDENTLIYDLSGVEYNAELLSYTVKGKGATASISYDDKTAVLSIRVEGNDFASNPESVTTYTIQFALPAPAVDVTPILGDYDSNLAINVGGTDAPATRSSISLTAGEEEGTVTFSIKDFEFGGMQLGDINLTGVAVSLLEDGTYELSLDEPQTLDLPTVGAAEVTLTTAKVENGELYASLSISAMGGMIAVTVEVSPYVVDVTPILGDYDSSLAITVGDTDAPATRSSISLAAGEEEGTVTFSIKDFEFGGMQLGDINLTGVAVSLLEDGTYELSLDEPQTLDLPTVGAAEVTLTTAKVENGELYASLSISAMGGMIAVTVEVSPYVEETPGVDVSLIVGDYKSKLVLELQGDPEPAVEGTVALAAGTDPETVDFTVRNFDILGMGVVDVTVSGVPVTMEEGVYTLVATGPQSSYQLHGTDGTVTLESATVTVSADKKELNAVLSLEWNGMPMTLTITPAGDVSIRDVAKGNDRIYAADGQIIAVTGKAKALQVIDLSGRVVRTVEATEGVNVISGLAQGMYIVNGEKVLVK